MSCICSQNVSKNLTLFLIQGRKLQIVSACSWATLCLSLIAVVGMVLSRKGLPHGYTGMGLVGGWSLFGIIFSSQLQSKLPFVWLSASSHSTSFRLPYWTTAVGFQAYTQHELNSVEIEGKQYAVARQAMRLWESSPIFLANNQRIILSQKLAETYPLQTFIDTCAPDKDPKKMRGAAAVFDALSFTLPTHPALQRALFSEYPRSQDSVSPSQEPVRISLQCSPKGYVTLTSVVNMHTEEEPLYSRYQVTCTGSLKDFISRTCTITYTFSPCFSTQQERDAWESLSDPKQEV